MMAQEAIVVDDDQIDQVTSNRRLLPQRNNQADLHELKKTNEAHVINIENEKHLGRMKVKQTIDSTIDSNKETSKSVNDEKDETSVPAEAPQGYERPVYTSSQGYVAPISPESSPQSPPQPAHQSAPAVSPTPVVYPSQAPTPIAAIPYTLTPQVQPIEYVPVRSRRVKSRPHIIEEDDDDDDEYTPKRKSRKVVYVIRKSKKQQQPTYTEDDEDDSGS